MGVASHLFGTANKRTKGHFEQHWVQTTVPPTEAIEMLCQIAATFPTKRALGAGTLEMRAIRLDDDGTNVMIAWGAPTALDKIKRKDGTPFPDEKRAAQFMVNSQWTVSVRSHAGYTWFALARARTRNGEIEQRRELERLLDEWFRCLQEVDPSAQAREYAQE